MHTRSGSWEEGEGKRERERVRETGNNEVESMINKDKFK